MEDDFKVTEIIFKYLSYIAALIIGAILYAIGYESVKAVFDHVKEYGLTFRKRERADLSGVWHAVWQTTVGGKENINTETLKIKQKGRKIILENIGKSPENKLGGYLWVGEMKFYDNEHLIGYYLPREKNVISKGSMYFLLNRVGNFMMGKWVGCNYDYEFTWGFGVIAKDKTFALEKMKEVLNTEKGLGNKHRGEL